WLAWGVLVVMAVWTVATAYGYSRPEQRTWRLVVADLAVALGCLFVTALAASPFYLTQAPPLSRYWFARAVLATGAVGGGRGCGLGLPVRHGTGGKPLLPHPGPTPEQLLVRRGRAGHGSGVGCAWRCPCRTALRLGRHHLAGKHGRGDHLGHCAWCRPVASGGYGRGIHGERGRVGREEVCPGRLPGSPPPRT